MYYIKWKSDNSYLDDTGGIIRWVWNLGSAKLFSSEEEVLENIKMKHAGYMWSGAPSIYIEILYIHPLNIPKA